ncbi:hypothetical protein UCREL1_8643 [Eutypa lata UCREL1]|uniref:Uncharacterized protein n=1 Tax=Eutypa lata (strain UCR-EL1) TaxID=1287681 RepID=M7SJP4_EUTLA|nr:hypothetical protein UCREL1_8643 [Eutypa lata UCREL1]
MTPRTNFIATFVVDEKSRSSLEKPRLVEAAVNNYVIRDWQRHDTKKTVNLIHGIEGQRGTGNLKGLGDAHPLLGQIFLKSNPA